ncbi:ParA family protein [Chitinilyticum piscinae]|uniref:ParA family protein n=1 Tax=Chitinilyticum piscinae TaxID=2866724 RepID=A0A8J7KCP8_9NEIS|nr:ParA family protein [Chitinilyticum piscinae]MBE9607974.1 ParA family protein [Chitinilyticum piscinae]
MRRILIANPKGGSGKSTLAAHLACWFAWQEDQVLLGDTDRQQSLAGWLQHRPPSLPRIHGWDVKPGEPARPPRGTQVAILDSPAGLHGKRLKALLGMVDQVIVPLQTGIFDFRATAGFLEELAETKALRRDEIRVAAVGMRVNTRTNNGRELIPFLNRFAVPLVTQLREATLYRDTIARGMTLFDLTEARTRQDRAQWQPLLDWVTAPR